MAWRPSQYLIDGELDNTTPNRVTGWLRFAGLADKITLDLAGNFHRDIRGASIRLTGDSSPESPTPTPTPDPDNANALQGFAPHQTGNAGDITAGRPPSDYVDYGYIEWYSDQNGRVVLELQPDQIKLLSQPIPAIESDPISRQAQDQNMRQFLGGIVEGINRASDD